MVGMFLETGNAPGAECIWKVELPTDSLEFDYDTITDFFLRVRYASVDVGDKLKTPARVRCRITSKAWWI